MEIWSIEIKILLLVFRMKHYIWTGAAKSKLSKKHFKIIKQLLINIIANRMLCLLIYNQFIQTLRYGNILVLRYLLSSKIFYSLFIWKIYIYVVGDRGCDTFVVGWRNFTAKARMHRVHCFCWITPSIYYKYIFITIFEF